MVKENQKLATVEAPSDKVEMMVARDPNIVLAEAKKAARALMTVVSQKKKPVIINGEQYLEFEDWMTVARFYGISVKVVRTGLLDLGGVKGFEATAEAIRNSDGMVISSAEAMCLNDEKNWSMRGDVPVPLFQLRSMAQTRACAKALRNILAWVVVLGGFKATPAEEMTGNETNHKPAVKMPKATEKKSQEQEVAEEVFNAEEQGLSVLQALKEPVGSTFDVWGVLFDFKKIVTKTKKDITYYQLSPRESTEVMEIAKFGKPHEGIANGDVVKFLQVKVQDYQGAKKYLAQEVEILEKGEDEATE